MGGDFEPSKEFPESLTGFWNFVADAEYKKFRPMGTKSPVTGGLLSRMNHSFRVSYDINPFDKSVTYNPIYYYGESKGPCSIKTAAENLIRLEERIGKQILPKFSGRGLTPNIIFNGNEFFYQEEKMGKGKLRTLKYSGTIDLDSKKVSLKRLYDSGGGFIDEVNFEGTFNLEDLSFEVVTNQWDFNNNSKWHITTTFNKPYKMYFWLADQSVYEYVKEQLESGKSQEEIQKERQNQKQKREQQKKEEKILKVETQIHDYSTNIVQDKGKLKKLAKKIGDTLENVLKAFEYISQVGIGRSAIEQSLSEGHLGKGSWLDAGMELLGIRKKQAPLKKPPLEEATHDEFGKPLE